MLTFDTNTLIGVVNKLHTPSSFLLDMFFPNIMTSDTEEVSIDIVKGQRKLAPFVSPLVEGKVMKGRTRQTKSLKPAYIKLKDYIDPSKPLVRAVGERIGGGELTAADRENIEVGNMLEDHIQSIYRRLESLAANALVNGKVVIAGEDYEAVEVDFGREAELTKALTGDAAWDAGAGASPTNDLEDWITLVLKLSGYGVTDVVFTPSSWRYFSQDPKFANYQNFAGGNQEGNDIRIGAEVKTGAVYKGRWGTVRLWLYNDWYLDEDGVLQPMVPDGSVILAGGGLQGIRAFGAIMDAGLNYPHMPIAPKSWVTDDPGVRWVMAQSAPIPIPSHVDVSMCVNVIGS